MNKINYKLFPTLVSVYDGFLTHTQTSDILEVCKSIGTIEHSSLAGEAGSTYNSGKKNIIQMLADDDRFSFLLPELYNCIAEYEKEIGIKPLRLTNSWFNIQQRGSFLGRHVHPDSVISGALYINVDHESSRLVFDNPNVAINLFNKTSDNLTEFTFERFNFRPTIGSLFLFPSWLFHGSGEDQNKTTDRLVISFNTNYK